jgi:hypothetical protein
MTTRRMARVLVATGLALVALASPALAQDGDSSDNDQIVLTGQLVIEEGRTVDTAGIFNGPATIAGTVTKDVFVFHGDVDISGTVDGDVFVLNGAVVVRSTAVIGGDLITRGGAQIEDGATIRGDQSTVPTRFDWDMSWFAGRFVWWIGYSISVLVLGLVLLAFAPQLDGAVREAFRTRLGGTIGWGIGLFFLLPIGGVILLITVVGIPLGLFVLLGLALIYTLGYTVATIAVGGRVMGSSSRFVAYLVAWLILRLLALIPVVGGLLWLAGTAWGLGLFAMAVRTGRKPRVTSATPVPPPPPMPVAS